MVLKFLENNIVVSTSIMTEESLSINNKQTKMHRLCIVVQQLNLSCRSIRHAHNWQFSLWVKYFLCPYFQLSHVTCFGQENESLYGVHYVWIEDLNIFYSSVSLLVPLFHENTLLHFRVIPGSWSKMTWGAELNAM